MGCAERNLAGLTKRAIWLGERNRFRALSVPVSCSGVREPRIGISAVMDLRPLCSSQAIATSVGDTLLSFATASTASRMALARRLLGMYQSSKNGVDPSFVALAILIIDVDIARLFFANRYV
jgi:hypothetical protein